MIILLVLHNILQAEQFCKSAAPLVEEAWRSWRTVIVQEELRLIRYWNPGLCCNTSLR